MPAFTAPARNRTDSDPLGVPADGAGGATPPPAETATDHPHPLLVRGHTPALDGLRGVAVILVLLFHFTPPGHGQTLAGAAIKFVAALGFAGVDLFFVLSGFLITGILADAQAAPHHLRTFYARRALRIFPLYYAVLFATLVVGPRVFPMASPDHRRVLADQAWLWCYAGNVRAALSPLDWHFSAGYLRMDHLWSLAVEEQFYLAWPVALLLVRRPGARLALCAALVALALAARAALYARGDPGLAFYVLTPCRLDALAAGALLALLARRPRRPPDAARLARAAWVTLAAAAALLAATWGTDLRAFVTGGTLLAALFAAALVLALTAPRLRRALAARPLRACGRYSYAMYVLHPLLLAVLADHVPPAALQRRLNCGPAGTLAFLALAFSATFAAAFATWHVYEKHFLRLKRFVEFRA